MGFIEPESGKVELAPAMGSGGLRGPTLNGVSPRPPRSWDFSTEARQAVPTGHPLPVLTTGQPWSLPQGPAMDAEVQGKRESLRAPEKDGEMAKRYREREEEREIVKTKDWERDRSKDRGKEKH